MQRCFDAPAASLPVSSVVLVIFVFILFRLCAGVMCALPAHWRADPGHRLGGNGSKDAGWRFCNRVSLWCCFSHRILLFRFLWCNRNVV